MSISVRLPQYQCHKKVWAFKISDIEYQTNQPGAKLRSADLRCYASVDTEYLQKHNPQLGGYYVLYDDGYESFSPADAFESGYALILPKSSLSSVEQMIVDKRLTAPRVTFADIEANIVSEHYFTAGDAAYPDDKMATKDVATYRALNLLTFCVLVLRNGFTVTGESACVSPENFDAEIGRDIAKKNAVSKIWSLMGYALKEKIAGETDHVLLG